ncbi:hypothetical protein M123_4238 [Bacteroides fragilis str. 3976T8]|uniref:Uncharacterized protein n=1 Tax=Bacteroides fragilis str. 3976T8 TaxID=1339314 RepID=A0A016CJA2_BACFG|nr:hypothetical protein M123_4238 [Bacteroides fragilis str. 3976T8]
MEDRFTAEAFTPKLYCTIHNIERKRRCVKMQKSTQITQIKQMTADYIFLNKK